MPEIRSVRAGELEALAELLNDVFRRAQGVHDQDVLSDFPLNFAAENLDNCRVICDGEQIVSHAAIWPRTLVVDGTRLKVGVIVLVATDPAYRRRGLASELMRDLQQRMRAEEYDLGILWTGVPEFYRALGWEVVRPRGWLADDLRPAARRLSERHPPQGDVLSFDATEHLGEVHAVHDREPVRLERSRRESEALLPLPKVELCVMKRGGEVAAYAALARGCNRRGVVEYGGRAEDVLPLVGRLASRWGEEAALPMVVYHTYAELAGHLAEAGVATDKLESSKGRGCEMIYVVNNEAVTPEVREQSFIWGLDFT